MTEHFRQKSDKESPINPLVSDCDSIGWVPPDNLNELRERAKNVRLLATDLDGTLLTRNHEVTPDNKNAIETCVKRGLCVVAATGRSRYSIPGSVTDIPGMKYLITANGAVVFESKSNDIIYERYLSREALEYVKPLLRDPEIMCELFWDGIPHVQNDCYRNARSFGVSEWFLPYFLKSRQPLDDLEAASVEAQNRIENINFVFRTEDVRERLRRMLATGEHLYELTTSLSFNFEIGGFGATKQEALTVIAKREGISQSETICFGDNGNDVGMLRACGISVVTANGVQAAKQAADFVTLECQNSGVAFALEKLGLI